MHRVVARALPAVVIAAAAAQDAAAAGAAFAPLEPCTAPYPTAVGGDPLPERLGPVQSGRRDGHLWAHARGYVHAPLPAVWAALRDPAVSRLRDGDGRVVPEAPAAAPVTFRIDYHLRVLLFDVGWQLAYRGGALEGSLDRLDAPGAMVGFRWDKSGGSRYIRTLSASLVAREAAPGVTAIEVVAWLDAERTGDRETIRTATEWFDRILARVHQGVAVRQGAAGR